MNDLFNDVWTGKDTISVDDGIEITLPVWVDACKFPAFLIDDTIPKP